MANPSRSVGPWYQGISGPDRSGTFFYFNTNKRSMVLDLERQEARAVMERLFRRADIVIESQPAGRLESLGLRLGAGERVAQRRPADGLDHAVRPRLALPRLPGLGPGAVRVRR